jgi:hypothetical protein
VVDKLFKGDDMENFFRACFTVANIKNKYRELARRFHPDLGGCQDTMKAINNQYHEALKGKHKTETTDKETGKTHTYYYNEKVEQAIIEKLRELLGLQLPEVTIELVGTWIWIHGNTKPFRKQLGKDGAKCKWHSITVYPNPSTY